MRSFILATAMFLMVESFAPTPSAYYRGSKTISFLLEKKATSTTGTHSKTRLYSKAAHEFLARAREASGQQQKEASAPPLFSNELLNDMQQCLVFLERRAKEGPGVLTNDEVDQFAISAQRILTDMKDRSKNFSQRIKPGDRQRLAEAAAQKAVEQAQALGKTQDEIQVVAKQAFDEAHQQQQQQQDEKNNAAAATTITQQPRKRNEREAAMGPPEGTANTYAIEGMDAMSPEEYQEALAQTVIARAEARRKTGGAGNRGTWDYLNHLQGGSDPLYTNHKDENDKK